MSEPQPQAVIMPNLIGQSTQAAYNTLTNDGVQVVTINAYGPGGSPLSAPSNSEFVADQSPCPGAPLEDSGATLWAVDQQGTNPFPEVVGQNASTVEGTLTADPYDLEVALTGTGNTVKSANQTASGCPLTPGAPVNQRGHVTLVTQRPVGGGERD